MSIIGKKVSTYLSFKYKFADEENRHACTSVRIPVCQCEKEACSSRAPVFFPEFSTHECGSPGTVLSSSSWETENLWGGKESTHQTSLYSKALHCMVLWGIKIRPAYAYSVWVTPTGEPTGEEVGGGTGGTVRAKAAGAKAAGASWSFVKPRKRLNLWNTSNMIILTTTLTGSNWCSTDTLQSSEIHWIMQIKLLICRAYHYGIQYMANALIQESKPTLLLLSLLTAFFF